MNFSIIGGDLRTVKLAKMLSKENEVYIYGIESEELNSIKIKSDKLKKEELNKIAICENLKDAIKRSEIILGPVPLTKDGETLNAPFSKQNIKIADIIKELNEYKTFIAGAIKKDIYEKINSKKTKIIDLMQQEDLTILNTIATAEGAIQVAIY